jgi:DNA-binding response OmpR family regulator
MIQKKHKVPVILLYKVDPLLQPDLNNALESNNFFVITVNNAENLYKSIISNTIDVVVIDIDADTEKYIDIIEFVSTLSNLSVIVLCEKSNLSCELKALAAGADRYLLKPVMVEDLICNIEAIVRTKQTVSLYSQLQQARASDDNGAWLLDRSNYQLISPSGKTQNLTLLEYKFLELFIHAQLQSSGVIDKQALAEQVYGGDDNRGKRLSLLLTRLRKKTQVSFGEALPIRTSYLVGYSFAGKLVLK